MSITIHSHYSGQLYNRLLTVTETSISFLKRHGVHRIFAINMTSSNYTNKWELPRISWKLGINWPTVAKISAHNK